MGRVRRGAVRSIDIDLVNFDDAAEAVRELHRRGIPLGVALSSPRDRLDRTLQRCGLFDYFDVRPAARSTTASRPPTCSSKQRAGSVSTPSSGSWWRKAPPASPPPSRRLRPQSGAVPRLALAHTRFIRDGLADLLDTGPPAPTPLRRAFDRVEAAIDDFARYTHIAA